MIGLGNFNVFQTLHPSFTLDVRKAFLVGIGANGSSPAAGILVMKNGEYYGIAEEPDAVKLLGVGPTDHGGVIPPKFPVKIQALCGKQVMNVCSGVDHVVAVTSGGDVYSWTGDRENRIPKLRMNTASGANPVIQIACGKHHAVALDTEEKVYAWGANEAGQLGNGQVDRREAGAVNHTFHFSPKRVIFGEAKKVRISQVACGDKTSYALDQTGRIWSWGYSSYGALGYKVDSAQPVPRKIESLSSATIVKIVAGSHHVLTLSEKNFVYFWGQHFSEDIIVKPKRVCSNLTTVVDIAAMRACPISVCMTDTTAYVWGYWQEQHIKNPKPICCKCMNRIFALAKIPMLYEPLVFQEEILPVLNIWKKVFNDFATGDITFRVEDHGVYAHKVFLKARSEHFRRMLQPGWQEMLNNTITIENFSFSGFKAFIRYLYTDRFEWTSIEQTIELIKISDYYGETDLQQRCEEVLEAVMTVDNICEIYGKAVEYGMEHLQKSARHRMLPMFNEVIKSKGYEKLSREVAFHLTRQLAEDNVFVGLKRPRVV